MTTRFWPTLTVRGAAGVALALAAAAPLALAQAPPPPAVVAPPTQQVASVNGFIITLGDIDALLRRQPPPPHPLTQEQRRQVQLEIVGMLIDDQLMQQVISELGPKVDPAEVDKELAKLYDSLKAQNKTMADFLKDSGQTPEQVRENAGKILRWTAYIKAQVTDETVKKYYDENKVFFDQVTVRAGHILLRVAPEGGAGDRAATRAKLQAVRQDIIEGKVQFGDAVAKHSQCPSASQGGDIGFFPRKFIVDDNVAKAAFEMKVGDLSDVIDTESGCHLLKVTDRKPGTPSVYEKIKDEVRDIYVEEIRQNILAQKRKTSKITVTLP